MVDISTVKAFQSTGALHTPFVTDVGPIKQDPLPLAVLTTSGASTGLLPANIGKFTPQGTLDGATQITVDTRTKKQTVLGVGASMTDSTAYCMMTYMSRSQRTALLQEAFGTNGFSITRICLGSSDYYRNTDYFSYDDVANDAALNNFDIARDEEYMIPLLKEMLAIQPRLRILASPWSPPTWMKSNNDWINGNFIVNDANLTTWANYLVKSIQAYQAAGIPIYALTPQNEVTLGSESFPGCRWLSASDYARFIGSFLGPALAAAGLSGVKLWAIDDNWTPAYGRGIDTNLLGNMVTAVFGASGVAQYVDGVAFHSYLGTAADGAALMAPYPGKSMHMTEHCFGTSDSIDRIQTQTMSNDLIGPFRYGHASVIMWNLVLDSDNQPAAPLNPNNRPCINVSKDGAGTLTRLPDYYALSHFGRFLQEGAQRVLSNSPAEFTNGTDVQSVAFTNPDGSVVVCLLNGASSTKTILLTDAVSGKSSRFAMASHAMLTVVYSGLTASVGIGSVSGAAAGGTMTVTGSYPIAAAPSGLEYSIDSGAWTAAVANTTTIANGFFSIGAVAPAAGKHTVRVRPTGTTTASRLFPFLATAASQAGQAWTPAALGSALVGWFRPKDQAKLTLNTSNYTGGTAPVSAIADKQTGDIMTQSTASMQPTYNPNGLNNLPALTFAGGQTLSRPTPPAAYPLGAAAMSLFVTASATHTSGNRKAFTYGLNDTKQNRALSAKADRSIVGSVYGNDADGGAKLWTSGGNVGGWTIAADGTSSVYMDGALSYTSSMGTLVTKSDVTTIGSIPYQGQFYEFWQGAIGEIVLTTGVLSAADRQKVEGYMAWEYGLQANLPSGHPYKSAAPTT